MAEQQAKKLHSVYKKGRDGEWYLRSTNLTEERALKQITWQKRQEPGCSLAMIEEPAGRYLIRRVYVVLPANAKVF